jgi:hypothetical protein
VNDYASLSSNLKRLVDDLRRVRFEDLPDSWSAAKQILGQKAGRQFLARFDRFYLLTVELNRPDAMHPWLYARCREVEANTDGHLDLWAREHYKSSIITFAGSIQEILRDPEITIGIFSHTKPVARKFMLQIKEELESNKSLQQLFPDIIWKDPYEHAVKWSAEHGIQVRRTTNAKEATVEAHGLVDGMPTGAHFRLRIYDDVVTKESVNTPEQVVKTTEAWALSDNLGARPPDGGIARAWHIGTRYHFGDTYQDIIDRKILKLRVHPATHDGTPTGKPVFLTQESWEYKKKAQASSVIACQMLLNPAAGTEAMFRKEWVKFTDIRPATLTIYIMCDPASSKKRGSDNTAIPVVGIDSASNKYLLDGYHHKMSLSERWAAIKQLRRHWMNQPGIQSVKVGYERYGATSDLEYFEDQMIRVDKDSFEVHELAWPREGGGSKLDRIGRLEPDFRGARFYLIAQTDNETTNQRKVREAGEGFRVMQPTRRRDHEGNVYALNKRFLEEFLVYPYSSHDDLLDATSRIYDMDPVPPVMINEAELEPEVFDDGV